MIIKRLGLDEGRPITIISFLIKFRMASGYVDVHEGAVIWPLSYLSSVVPKSLYRATLISPEDIHHHRRATDQKITTYFEGVY